MYLFEKLKTNLVPTKKWHKFLFLFVYFSLIVFIFNYYQTTRIRDVYDISSINNEVLMSMAKTESLIAMLYFPVVLAIATEFSVTAALIGSLLFLFGSFIFYPIISGTPRSGEGFGYFIFALFIYGFWSIPVSFAGFPVRFLVNKLRSVHTLDRKSVV